MGNTFVLQTGLSKEKTREVFPLAFESYSKDFSQYKPQFDWQDDTRATFSFYATPSMPIRGNITIMDQQVEVRFATLPFLAQLFMPQAMDKVNQEVKRWATI